MYTICILLEDLTTVTVIVLRLSIYLLSFYYSTYCVPCQPPAMLCYLVLLILRIATAPFLIQSRLCICVITLRTILPSLKITSYIISTSPFYTHIITYVMGLRNMQFAQIFANIFVQYAYWQTNRRPLYKASVADAEKWIQYISIKRKHFAFNISKVLLLYHLSMYLSVYLSIVHKCCWSYTLCVCELLWVGMMR